MARARDLGMLWHGLIGFATGAASGVLWWAGGLFAIGAFLLLNITAVAFYAREVVQHDPYLSRHQRLEAATPIVGYGLGLLLLVALLP